MVSLLRMMLFCIMYHLSFEFMVTQADIQCVRECVHSKTYQHPTRDMKDGNDTAGARQACATTLLYTPALAKRTKKTLQ